MTIRHAILTGIVAGVSAAVGVVLGALLVVLNESVRTGRHER